MVRFIVASLFVLSAGVVLAQSTTVLENNPALKWQQINTDNFRIIFPEGYQVQAQRMANTLEHIRKPESETLSANPRKLSVILQNQSAVSNGFVSITPRRSEFYGMPSQNYNFTGNLDWLDLLATHEYRHVIQFQQANRGFNRFLYTLFGANTLAAMSFIAVPQWFWEGDAVTTETELTTSGRGRIPNFNLLFRTNLQEGRVFNYHKQYLRSYKHNIPDHYVLGFNMVSYLRKRTDNPQVWDSITQNAWSKSILPFTFSNSIKKYAGLHVTDLYNEMATDLLEEWKQTQAALDVTPYESILTRKDKSYTDYRFPIEIASDTVLALKSGIGHIEELVVISNGKERKIWTPGIMNGSGMLSAAQGKIVWNEYRYDPRWRVRTYSVIMSYDTKTKIRRPITQHSRYASAALSPEGNLVATVETSVDYKTRLVVVNFDSGLITHSIENPEGYFISMPRWRNNKEVVALLTHNMKKAIGVINIETQQVQLLTEFSEDNVGHPVPFGDYVLYNSPRTGIDNVFALNTVTNESFQITTSKYGAYNPSVSLDGKTLFYNEQGRDGLDVVKIPFSPENWKPMVKEIVASPFAASLFERGNSHVLDSVPNKEYAIKGYSQLAHAINPHSWGAYVNSDLTQVDIGVTSRDVLSTTSISAGYVFDIYERTGTWRAGLSYQGLYPIFDFNFSSGKRSVNEGDVTITEWLINKQNDTTVVNNTQNLEFTWDEKTVTAGIRFPFLTTHSRYHSSVTFSNYVGYTRVTDFSNSVSTQRYVPALIRYDTINQSGSDVARTSILSVYPFFDYVGNGDLIYNQFVFSAYRLLKQSRRDINSKWGQSIQMELYSTPFKKSSLEGGLFAFTGYLYFPGVLKHHSFWGYWAYQNQLVDTEFSDALDDYLFRNRIPLPRGQTVYRFKEFYSMSANYTLPIWYPDIAVGPIVNFQRLRANLFLDYGFGEHALYSGTSAMYLSTGAEVKFDINVFRLLPQLDVGFRYSYGIDPSTSRFEFLIGTINF